jgi:hypothetical protein
MCPGSTGHLVKHHDEFMDRAVTLQKLASVYNSAQHAVNRPAAMQALLRVQHSISIRSKVT